LKVPLSITIRMILATGDDRFIGCEKIVTDGLQEGEALLKARFVEIVEEQAANTTCFIAML